MSPAFAVAEPGTDTALAKQAAVHRGTYSNGGAGNASAISMPADKKNPARSGARRIIPTLRYDASN
jgi:hypothetical protein